MKKTSHASTFNPSFADTLVNIGLSMFFVVSVVFIIDALFFVGVL